MKMSWIGNNSLWTTDPTLNYSWTIYRNLCFSLSETGSYCKVWNRDVFQFTYYKCYSNIIDFVWLDMRE